MSTLTHASVRQFRLCKLIIDVSRVGRANVAQQRAQELLYFALSPLLKLALYII